MKTDECNTIIDLPIIFKTINNKTNPSLHVFASQSAYDYVYDIVRNFLFQFLTS